MIPATSIEAWRRSAPWTTETQVEQDLVLSRLMVEIADHELLGPELSLAGKQVLRGRLAGERSLSWTVRR